MAVWKKIAVLLVLPLCFASLSGAAYSAEERYTPVKAIGYGPLAGELIRPVAIGIDELSRSWIYVVDSTSKTCSIYMHNGILSKSFAIPEAINTDRIRSSISASGGIVCYTTGNEIVRADRSGEVLARIPIGSESIVNPVLARLNPDQSIWIIDSISGLLKISDKGKLVSRFIDLGKDVPTIDGGDIGNDGSVAILTITPPAIGEEPVEKMPFNSIKMTVFDKNGQKVLEFPIETNENFNPSAGQVKFDPKGNICFMGNNSSLLQVYDKTGSKISEFTIAKFGSMPLAFCVAFNGNIYGVDGSRFFATNSQGKPLGEYGAFGGKPMQFGNPVDLAVCGQNGFAVFDSHRNDMQFFGQNGVTGTRQYGQNTVKLTLSTSQEGNVLAYNPSNSTIKIYDCAGNPSSDAINVDKVSQNIASFSPSKDGDILAVDREKATIIRFNKIGKFVHQFGSQGIREGQLAEPSDVFVGPDGNVYVLEAVNSRIQVFKPDGTFVRMFGEKLLSKPESFTLTSDYQIVVADTGNDRLAVFGLDGVFAYSIGSTSPSKSRDTIKDYWSDLGTFRKPTKVRSANGVLYVLDHGNLRIQVFQKEKIAPKISSDQKSFDFGMVKQGENPSKQLIIKNSGNGVLDGTVEIQGNWIEISRNKLTGNETILTVRVLSEKMEYWGSTAKIIIKSNGGNIEIECKGTKKGKLITLQVNSPTAIVDDKQVSMANPPSIIGGSTFVPLRFIGEALGAKVDWDANEKKVTYILADRTVVLWIGRKSALVNNKEVEFTAAPVIVKGSTMVPLRAVGEALGATVEWIAQSKTINIYYPPNPKIG
ncbi:MAG: hypothetical protein GX421_04915 [Caldisericales bacterium]|nr:hypothetical protein [Caldisericales bacterium]